MEKIAFKMQLKPGFEAEYKRRHDEIWPELSATLEEAGIREYLIFLDEETGTLFAFQKRLAKHSTNLLPQLPIMKKWWAYMADIMEVNPDQSPVVADLQEVFHMDVV